MKLLEKLKNTFFEEEYIEVEEPENKKQEVARKIEPKEIEREETKAITPSVKDEIEVTAIEDPKKVEDYSDKAFSTKDSKLPYFEDEDFMEVDVKEYKQDKPTKIYGASADELYNSINHDDIGTNKSYNPPVKEKFKPTPIISPIYGILDKNYYKEEVVDKKEKTPSASSYVSRKNVDLDSVRKKAYGGLEPLEESSKTTNSAIEDTSEDDNSVYDMTSDNSKPVVDQVTIADAEEYFEDLGLEYNIDYKDSRYEKATGRRVTQQHQNTEEDNIEENDIDSENNLFDLIDTMYEEGEE